MSPVVTTPCRQGMGEINVVVAGRCAKEEPVGCLIGAKDNHGKLSTVSARGTPWDAWHRTWHSADQ